MTDNPEALKRANRIIKDAEHKNAMADGHAKGLELIGEPTDLVSRYDSVKLALAVDVIDLAAENEDWRKSFESMEDAWRDRVYKLQDENERLKITMVVLNDTVLDFEDNVVPQLRQDNQKLIEAVRTEERHAGEEQEDDSLMCSKCGAFWPCIDYTNAAKVLSEIEQRND